MSERCNVKNCPSYVGNNSLNATGCKAYTKLNKCKYWKKQNKMRKEGRK